MFCLFNILVAVAIGIVLGMVGAVEAAGTIGGLYNLAALLPGLAVTARRLHETGRSAWWILILLLPFVGAIVFLVFMCLDSQPGVNQYGVNPKE